MSIRQVVIFATLGASLIIVALILALSSSAPAVRAQEGTVTETLVMTATTSPQEPPATGTPSSNLSISNDVCLSCHGVPGQTMKLDNGDILDLYVREDLYHASVHGTMGYACVQCHTDVGEYPHPPFSAANLRDVTLKLNKSCSRCHTMEAELVKDSVHASAQAAGYLGAAVCVDCHTAHTVRRLNDPTTHELLPDTRIWIPQRCALCHNSIYQKYKASVHGTALSEGNPDVPTCIDCHGVHNIENPQTAYFRLRSPEICAKCHTDPKRMSKYGISTDVLNTYVSDFHGTTVAIFEKTAPDARVNKPVCYDCHGVHDISRVDDPNTGLEMKGNLLARCQVCHPDASANFPTAWMSHYIPSPDHYALVYYVNLFYRYFIPITLGGMALLVVMDAGRTLINRSRRKRKTEAIVESKEEASVATAPSAEKPASEPAKISELETLLLEEHRTSVESSEASIEPENTEEEKIPDSSAADDSIETKIQKGQVESETEKDQQEENDTNFEESEGKHE
jgi:hypothetical protein